MNRILSIRVGRLCPRKLVKLPILVWGKVHEQLRERELPIRPRALAQAGKIKMRLGYPNRIKDRTDRDSTVRR